MIEKIENAILERRCQRDYAIIQANIEEDETTRDMYLESVEQLRGIIIGLQFTLDLLKEGK